MAYFARATRNPAPTHRAMDALPASAIRAADPGPAWPPRHHRAGPDVVSTRRNLTLDTIASPCGWLEAKTMPTISLGNIIDWLRGSRSIGPLAMVESILDVVGWAARLMLDGKMPASASPPSGVPADDEALADALQMHMPASVGTSAPPAGAFPWAALLPVLLDLLRRFLPSA
jgi:hypothetical protein